jgi:hypothetical protein
MSRDLQRPDAPTTIGAASDKEFMRAIKRAERGVFPSEAKMREFAERIGPLMATKDAARVFHWRLSVLAIGGILVIGAASRPWHVDARASAPALASAPAGEEARRGEEHVAPPPPEEPAAAAPVVSVDSLPTAIAPPRPRAALAEPTCPGEIELVEAVHAALRAGDAEGALDRARQLEARCKNGRLVQERERLAIEALARLGRSDEVQVRARAFEQRFPSSPHVWRIRSLAEGDSR